MGIGTSGIGGGRDEDQDRRIAKIERIMEEILGLGSDELVSRLEKVDLELDFVRSRLKEVNFGLDFVRSQYSRKWRYRFIDWYRSQLS